MGRSLSGNTVSNVEAELFDREHSATRVVPSTGDECESVLVSAIFKLRPKVQVAKVGGVLIVMTEHEVSHLVR
jgi:hypothetical protein